MTNTNSYVIGVDHVRFHVDNALQTAAYYISNLGFVPMAYEGLETGNKDFCTHVIRQNDIVLAFTSPLHKAPCVLQTNVQLHPYLFTTLKHFEQTKTIEYKDEDPIRKFYKSLEAHGSNHAHDMALLVSDVEKAYEQACKHPKTKALTPPTRLYLDEDKSRFIEFACIATQFGEDAWIHTLINRDHQGSDIGQVFLPGFRQRKLNPDQEVPPQHLEYVDHFAIAIHKGTLIEGIQWYSEALGFERFYNNDDEEDQKGIQIESSEKDLGGLTTMVVAPSLISSLNRHIELHELNKQSTKEMNESEIHHRRELIASKVMKKMIKFVLIEPVNTKQSKSQIQEFLDYNDGPGIAHLAVHTEDIINAVSKSRKAGVDYITVPPTYYTNWREKKELYDMVNEDWTLLEKNAILVDGVVFSKEDDESLQENHGFRYLLQTFTKPIEDRPTFYFEIISRRGNSGFGKGNIKALFDAIERLQIERGNLFIEEDKQ
ncbi:4-hydroxyphenylpyruvate dioxygenase [Naegleria gruberi]|uniref:4-hydroxyphenylpyruvate dioxygenase n=1 Tax=Naegleria gruberi TaxID=5762 RepID=D2VB68_NAEGR|nr:4-hydroxyphenylpyruvate dioxygenase [Naegleria gruberi]EFC45745.1 4-hydroxyphenylpyruvate dioxygenase [Naegleria gruberi]|eukprot:XP_002678489.1 4-hydroxyphenylpyruvate dioxygenase [Naegleria gruberi strain NEG-M]